MQISTKPQDCPNGVSTMSVILLYVDNEINHNTFLKLLFWKGKKYCSAVVFEHLIVT